ncbi:SRC kinase signaling inhibitor 1-like isoform X5 [Anguilla rostrata]
MISTDDAEYPREYRTLGNGTRRFSNVGLVHTSERRHTVIAAQSLEALGSLQKADMERKRDVFLDHLKNKYPPQHPPSPSQSHGSMRGAPDRTREQQQPNYWSFKSRSPRHSQSTQSGLADQAAKLSFASAESLETMSEADIPLGFNRMNRFRQSLPLSRSASQTKLRSPGVLFLQYGDETRRVHITHELSSLDTLHALIVHMFPQKLTMGMLKSPNTAILIKDEARNVFYELEDVRDIQDRSIIKIYRKEPIYASYPAAHLANGDLRREMVYTSRDSSPTRRLNSGPSSASPPSASPSRSRLSYGGGRPPSFVGPAQAHPHAQHHPPSSGHPHALPHPHPHPHHAPPAGLSPSPSAILERRDVKPDEEVTSKNMVLLKNEGLYADPYGLVHEGRLSIASTQSLAAIGDPFAFPVSGGLYRRGSVRSLSTYSAAAAALQGELEEALYKPGGPLYPDAYASTLGVGFRMPPSSPQKVPEAQLRDRDSYSGSPGRGSPVRQAFRKDSSSSVFAAESPKSRAASGSDPLCGAVLPGGDMNRGTTGTPGYNSPLPGNETETRERMEAMEKQIASLTGLVQSVLTRAPDSDSAEKTESANDCSGAGTGRIKKRKALTPSAPLALMPPPPAGAAQATTVTRLQMQLHLHDLQHNATELRDQLSQLRKMQLQNQDSVRSLLKRTETEISVRVTDALRKQEDPLQRQRLLVEEERLKYLNEEELIIQQLHDLEKSVEEIQKDSSVNHRLVTAQELEEKATVLRKLGETLTELKNQFPSLQSKMRVVLRVEVEAVKFLKEEPHRLDALLKRCKTVTDTLTTLRRQVNEGTWKSQEDFASSLPKQGDEFSKSADFDIPTSPPLSLNSLGGSTSLSNWTPHSSPSQGNPSGLHHDPQPPGSLKNRALDDLSGRRGVDKSVSAEVRLAAERDWEEKRANLTQYSAQDINRLLEETQAELMKAIPDLDFAAKQINKPSAIPVSQSGNTTPEHRPNKPQHSAHKLSSKEPGSRRGSDELMVPRYRTEKPSKSPPPPPPRRSFPSSHGLTTNRSGEVIVTSKTIKKSESEETETQKPHVKLRRTVSEAPRPASTPPVIAASGVKEDDDEEKIIAELEVFQRAPIRVKVSPPHSLPSTLRRTSTPPSSLDLWPSGAAGRKTSSASLDCSSLRWELGKLYKRNASSPAPDSQERDVTAPSSSSSQVPRIMLTDWTSVSSSRSESPVRAGPEGHFAQRTLQGITTGRGCSNVKSPHQAFGVTSAIDPRLTTVDDQQLTRIGLTPQKQSQALPKVSKPPEEIPAVRTQRRPQSYELRIQESFEEAGGEEGREDLALILTDREVRVLSGREAQKLSSSGAGQEVRTVMVQPEAPEGDAELPAPGTKPCRLQLSSTPLILLFGESLQVKEAYRQLEALLEEDEEEEEEEEAGDLQAGGQVYRQSQRWRPVPKPRMARTQGASRRAGPRIQLPKGQLVTLREALRQGLQTGNRTLQLLISAERDASTLSLRVGDCRSKSPCPGVSASTPNGSARPQQSRAEGGGLKGALAGDVRSSTFQRLDSLEETIRVLENTLQEISANPSAGYLFPRDFLRQLSSDSRSEPCSTGQITEGPIPPPRTADSEATSPSPISKKKPPVPPKPSGIPVHLIKVFPPSVVCHFLFGHTVISLVLFWLGIGLLSEKSSPGRQAGAVLSPDWQCWTA